MTDTNEDLGKSDTEILGLLRAQRETSIGFDQDKQINEDRARALDYYRGKHEGYIAKDLPVTEENRSKVVSTDVADMVETALPDIMEVLAGSDDILTFDPLGPDDEDAAKQETDYVRHVIFKQNPGWKLIYTGVKDALLAKTGIWHYYWDATPEYEEYEEDVAPDDVMQLQMLGVEITGMEESEQNPGYLTVTARKMVKPGRLVIESVAPEDFTVGRDTVDLPDTDYCAQKVRTFKQDLIADGFDPEIVAMLDGEEVDEDVDLARDTAEEHTDETDPGSNDLEPVELVRHYIRLIDDEGEPQIYQYLTGNDEAVLLKSEKRSRIEYASICPYPMTHRFYGQSAADKAIEIQKWATSYTRLMNDSVANDIYQRQEVAYDQIVPGATLEQLVKNSPGYPVVTKNGNGLRPIQSGSPSFDLLAALEYIKTVGEQRLGIVRAAQGLNPDTLHDTARGAEALVNAAQKRIRMMARMFAETGLKELFLGVHDLLRSNATVADTIRLRGTWVEIEPSSWRRRQDMSVEIGVGSGGRDADLNMMREAVTMLERLLNLQAAGGAKGPYVTNQNVYAFADSYFDKLGVKNPERFVTDPSQQPPEQPGMDPEVQKMQAELQAMQQKEMAKLSIEQQKMQLKAQLDKYKIDTEAQLKREQVATEAAMGINPPDIRFGGRTG